MTKQQKAYHTELIEDGSGRTLTQEIIRRFRKNRMAVAALCVVALLLLISVGTVVVDLVTGKEIYRQFVVGQDLMMKFSGEPVIPCLSGCLQWGWRRRSGGSWGQSPDSMAGSWII